MNRITRREIAKERVQILEYNILCEIAADHAIAEKQAKLALRIISRNRIKTPYSLRQLFCRNCKEFIVPGKTSRIRMGRARLKAIRITCLKCFHVYRKKIEYGEKN